jgi:hypothetical protein
LAEGIGLPPETLARGCPINKVMGNLSSILLKNLHVKLKIQEATDSFKNYQKFILFNHTSVGKSDLVSLSF